MIGIMLESVFQGWPGHCVVFLTLAGFLHPVV